MDVCRCVDIKMYMLTERQTWVFHTMKAHLHVWAPLGPCGPGPCGRPWALVGRALWAPPGALSMSIRCFTPDKRQSCGYSTIVCFNQWRPSRFPAYMAS